MNVFSSTDSLQSIFPYSKDSAFNYAYACGCVHMNLVKAQSSVSAARVTGACEPPDMKFAKNRKHFQLLSQAQVHINNEHTCQQAKGIEAVSMHVSTPRQLPMDYFSKLSEKTPPRLYNGQVQLPLQGMCLVTIDIKECMVNNVNNILKQKKNSVSSVSIHWEIFS